jgi:transposase
VREKRVSAAADAYVPLSFAPGEAYQFDWSHEYALIDGVTTTVKVAHVRLCHSPMMFVRAYPRETQEMVFDAHERAFALFKGACSRGVYDNLWTPPLQGDFDVVSGAGCANLSGLSRSDDAPGLDGSPQPVAS